MTENCLRSLLNDINGMDFEIWVVDNNSSDNSVEMIKSMFPDVKLIGNKENVGFARANNQVLREAKGDYFLLLNSDTVVPPGSLRGLWNYMDDNPQIAALGPKLKNAEGVVERPLKPLPSLLGELRYCLVNHFFPFGRFFESLFSGNKFIPSKTVRSEVLSAACLVIRKEVIEEVGGLSEEYFLFSEENDFFYRMAGRGFRGYYNPDIEIIHLIGKSRGKRGNIDSEKNFLKSRRLYFKKFHGRDLIMFSAIYYFFLTWSYLAAILKKALGGNAEYPRLYRELLKTLSGVE